MSLNIGNIGCDAARDLQNDKRWREVIDAIGMLATKHMNDALSAPDRSDATGYARALRDLYVAFVAATEGKSQNHIPKPGVERK